MDTAKQCTGDSTKTQTGKSGLTLELDVKTVGSVSLSATTVTITLPMRLVDYPDSLSGDSMIDTTTTPSVKIVFKGSSYLATTVTATPGSSNAADKIIVATFTTTATIAEKEDITVHVTGIKNPPSTKIFSGISIALVSNSITSGASDYTLEACVN
jgi:hypothetical protein